MRACLLILASALVASPALAEQPAARPGDLAVPSALTDPAMIDRLTEMMKALSSAFLNMPVGELAAAAEGRAVTEADKRRTIRSETELGEQELKAQIEASKPAMRAGMKAMAAALPAMMNAMESAREEMERATANMPRPDYPKR